MSTDHYLRTVQHYDGAPSGTLVEDPSGTWQRDPNSFFGGWECVGGDFVGVHRRSSTMAGTRRRIVRWGWPEPPIETRPEPSTILTINPPPAVAVTRHRAKVLAAEIEAARGWRSL